MLAAPAAVDEPGAAQGAGEHALRDFVLSGAELQGEARARFAQIQEPQAELRQRFSEHVLDATDSHALYVDEAELAGVPDDVIQAARARRRPRAATATSSRCTSRATCR